MNKDQRKYLTTWVERGFNAEEKKIKDRHYARPSLNNYLVAAALDRSLQLQPIETILDYIRDAVKTLGVGEVMVTRRDDDYGYYGGGNKRRLRKRGGHEVTLEAERVFVMPMEYEDALAKWETNEADLKAAQDKLEGLKETILLKVNIGSDKALEAVIAQADDLGSLDLINRQLTTATSPINLLES